MLQIASLAAYADLLRQDAGEANILFRDLLIGVTNFFRDAKAFEALQQLVMPRLFEGKRALDTIRVWVPGCATGEEVYSLAIMLREQAEQNLSENVDLAGRAMAAVHLYRAVVGTQRSPVAPHLVGGDVGLQPAKQRVGTVVGAEILVGLRVLR